MPYRVPGRVNAEPPVAPPRDLLDGDATVGALLLIIAIPRLVVAVRAGETWGAGATLAAMMLLLGLSCLPLRGVAQGVVRGLRRR